MSEIGREAEGAGELDTEALVIDGIGLNPVLLRSRESILDSDEVQDVAIGEISVAAQMRAEFPEEPIRSLAQSINSTKLLHPIHICRMDEATAREYVNYTNELWGRNVSFDSFTPVIDSDTQEYDVLIMGERRLRAMSMLDDYVEGRKPTKVYRWRTNSTDSFSYLTAVQAAENLHEKPDTYRFAVAAYTLYETGEYPSVAAFVEEIGGSIGESQAYNAVAFFKLPEEVRIKVERGDLVYSTAVEIARHQQNVLDMVLDNKVDNYLLGNDVENLDDVPRESLEQFSAEAWQIAKLNAVVMTDFAINRNMSAARVSKARGKWLEEIQYEQLGLSAMVAEKGVDSLHRVEVATTKYLREILNDASRATEHSGKAIQSLLAFFGGREEASQIRARLESNVVRVLKGQKTVIESVASEYPDSESSELASYLLKILEEHPDPSLDGITNLSLSE